MKNNELFTLQNGLEKIITIFQLKSDKGMDKKGDTLIVYTITDAFMELYDLSGKYRMLNANTKDDCALNYQWMDGFREENIEEYFN